MTPQDLLRLHPFFSTLAAPDMRKLLAQTVRRRVPAGRVLFRKEEGGDGLYGVLSGRIAFTIDSVDGKELILNIASPGEFFGEIALLDGLGRTAGAVARDDCELLFIGRGEFMDFVRQRPETMLHIIALLCARLRRSTGYIEDSAFLGLATRLAKQLVVLIHNGQGRPGEATIRISQAELANMLGVSRERVSRQLTVWSEAGILVQGRGMIIVRDEQALKRVTGGG